MVVQNFQKIRVDGSILGEPVRDPTVPRPQRITALQWEFDGKSVMVESRFGLLSYLTHDAGSIVVLKFSNEEATLSSLEVFFGDGELRRQITNNVFVAGRERSGQFRWFEKPLVSLPTAFGVIFEADQTRPYQSGGMWQLDIDAPTGMVVGESERR